MVAQINNSPGIHILGARIYYYDNKVERFESCIPKLIWQTKVDRNQVTKKMNFERVSLLWKGVMEEGLVGVSMQTSSILVVKRVLMLTGILQ